MQKNVFQRKYHFREKLRLQIEGSEMKCCCMQPRGSAGNEDDLSIPPAFLIHGLGTESVGAMQQHDLN